MRYTGTAYWSYSLHVVIDSYRAQLGELCEEVWISRVLLNGLLPRSQAAECKHRFLTLNAWSAPCVLVSLTSGGLEPWVAGPGRLVG